MFIFPKQGLAGKSFADKANEESDWAQVGSIDVMEDFTRKIEYGNDTGLFCVTVTHVASDTFLKTYFQAACAPSPAIDLADLNKINTASEQMVLKLEG